MNPALTILETLDSHLAGPAEIRLIGGAALILGYGLGRSTEDADLLLDDQELAVLVERAAFGDALEHTNAQLEPLGLYVTHIWGPDQQILGRQWRERCRRLALPSLQHLTVSVLDPLDLILSKLCRADDGDMADMEHLVRTQHLAPHAIRAAIAEAVVPEVFQADFPGHVARLEALLTSI